MDHRQDVYSPLSDQASDHAVMCTSCLDEEHYYFRTESCETLCKPDDGTKCWTCSQNLDHKTCMRTCQAKLHHDMNMIALEWDMELESNTCSEAWENKMEKKEFDGFAQVMIPAQQYHVSVPKCVTKYSRSFASTSVWTFGFQPAVSPKKTRSTGRVT